MKDKIAVIYKSKYGSTKKYAGWIALKLDADLYEVSDIRDKDLKEYSTIIYGGGIYAGKINGINFLNRNLKDITNKEVILFMVGMNEYSNDYENYILDINIEEEMKNNIKIFYLRGNFNYKELSIIDKVLMLGLKHNISSKDKTKLKEEEKMILRLLDGSKDYCNKKSIDNIIYYMDCL